MRKSLFLAACFVSSVFLFWVTSHGASVYKAFPSDYFYDIAQVQGTRDSTALAAAITAVGSDKVNLYFDDGAWTITLDAALNANSRPVFHPNALFTITSGKTLTINHIDTSGITDFQHFSGDADAVSFANAVELHPEWWGADKNQSTDDRDALQACITAAAIGATIRIPSIIRLESRLDWDTNALRFIGYGMARSTVYLYDGTWSNGFGAFEGGETGENVNDTVFKDFTIDGSNLTNGNSPGVLGIKTWDSARCLYMNLKITGTTGTSLYCRESTDNTLNDNVLFNLDLGNNNSSASTAKPIHFGDGGSTIARGQRNLLKKIKLRRPVDVGASNESQVFVSYSVLEDWDVDVATGIGLTLAKFYHSVLRDSTLKVSKTGTPPSMVLEIMHLLEGSAIENCTIILETDANTGPSNAIKFNGQEPVGGLLIKGCFIKTSRGAIKSAASHASLTNARVDIINNTIELDGQNTGATDIVIDITTGTEMENSRIQGNYIDCSASTDTRTIFSQGTISKSQLINNEIIGNGSTTVWSNNQGTKHRFIGNYLFNHSIGLNVVAATSFNDSVMEDNIIESVTTVLSGNASGIANRSFIIKNNEGFVTVTSDTAIVSNGNTSVTVTHGVGRTPLINEIQLTPQEDVSAGAASAFWADTINSTTFNINMNQDPTTDTSFSWAIDVSGK